MKNKMVNGFFGVVSWGVWAFMIFIMVFSVVLLFTGMNKAPVFTLNSAELVKAEKDDETLLQKGKSGEDWYILTLNMEVSAAVHSPFTYTADTFELKATADILAQCDNFTVIDEALTYSKAAPDSYVLSLYINCPDETLLESRINDFGFGIRGLIGHLGFIKNPFYVNLPGFYLSEFPETQVGFNAA